MSTARAIGYLQMSPPNRKTTPDGPSGPEINSASAHTLGVKLCAVTTHPQSCTETGPHTPCTAGINRSNTAVRAPVLEQPCSTGGRTGTVRPKREPTGRTDLSDRSRLVLCDRSQELIGQACPTRRQVLRSDSACPTTGRTRLFEHRSNCRVRPVNAGSDEAAPQKRAPLLIKSCLLDCKMCLLPTSTL
ncbi:hypothetical protein PCANC_12889 [Puccinia coronata f. sp. avenae]|uniref:Uncharacterized protein n=1 Tax=Puccinia coronata f. sp. avenae TaxID=200324 RepID=A0A2N5VE65_9BASI|nr:hypothetical protein PCANC_12889 [Puccinia coronata f. sp. avenae]